MSKDEQDTVVGLHNEKRAKVANGDETKGRGKQQPGAANMMELVKYSKVQAVYNIIRERMNGTLVFWGAIFCSPDNLRTARYYVDVPSLLSRG